MPLATPFTAHIDICNVCNFKCKFCFQADDEAIKSKGLKRGFMKYEIFCKICDDLSAFPEKLKKVKIGVLGEPTLHNQLPEMITYVKASNCADIVEMFTNASMLKPELCHKIVGAGLDRINISIEAVEDANYKEITQSNVNFKEIVKNVQYLYENRKQLKLYVKIADTGLSDEEKHKFYDIFGNICDEIFIEIVTPQWSESNKLGLKLAGIYGQEITRRKYVCPYIFMHMQFVYDGTIVICPIDWATSIPLGHVSADSIIDVWNGDLLRKNQILHLEKKRFEIPFCQNCSASETCCLDDLDDDAEEILQRILKR